MIGMDGRQTVISRRSVLKGALSAGLAAPEFWAPRQAHAQFKNDPFSLGVASGEPAPDGFVIWTRLAPEPLQGRGGMTILPVEVTWEIAIDPGLSQVVGSGTAIARAELGHSVHVEVGGLKSEREYFYRFRAGNAVSAIGRARTLPVAGADVPQMKFGVAGCQAWEGGHYTAWRHLADERFDFVFHYGDYIYEHAHVTQNRLGQPLARVMPQDYPTCLSEIDYRRRYALYKSDPDLQAAHASCTFVSSFDDHEVVDNWASETDSKNTPAEAFLFRRAAAFKAWYEHMPVRSAQLPRGPDVRAYRSFRIGNLANLSVLDTRQYRSKQPCGDGFKDCPEADEPGRTMMGTEQETWFANRLRDQGTKWQVLAQQVLFAHMDWRSFPWVNAHDAPASNMDGWDGATAARERVLRMLREAAVTNAVVLTGDMHRGCAFDLHEDWRDPGSPRVGAEFLATSISSGGDGVASLSNAAELYAQNPHLKYMSDQRGYHRHIVTPREWRADFRVVEKISSPGMPITTARSFMVEAGHAGLAEP